MEGGSEDSYAAGNNYREKGTCDLRVGRECMCVYIYIYTEEGSIIANETNTTPDRDRCLEMAS